MRRLIALLVTAAACLAACTSGDDQDRTGPTTAVPPMTTPTASTTNSHSAPTASPSTSSITRSTPTDSARPSTSTQSSPLGTSTTTTPPVTSVPTGAWPTDFSADQVAWLQAAWARYLEFEEIYRTAEQDPHGQDWVTVFGQYARGRPYSAAQESIDILTADDLTSVSDTRRQLTSGDHANESRVEYTVCLRAGAAQLIDSTGAVIATADPVTAVMSVVSIREGGSDWLVVEENPLDGSTC